MKEKITKALALAKQLCLDMEADKKRKYHPEFLEVQTLVAIEEAERELRALVPWVDT